MLVAFQRNIYRAASYCYPGVRMNFVFDQSKTQHVQSGILRCFAAVKLVADDEKHPISERVGDLTFADSSVATPLQAADLLAYEMHRYTKQKRQGLDAMRDVYKIALLHMKDIEDFWLFDQPRFERIKGLFPEESNREIESRIDSVQCSDESDIEGQSEGCESGDGSGEAS